jgi:hypothetical protein
LPKDVTRTTGIAARCSSLKNLLPENLIICTVKSNSMTKLQQQHYENWGNSRSAQKKWWKF